MLKTSPIPQFALYGETVSSHSPEFAHIEDIHDRSSRNGWVIKPHRHTHLFQILCMYSGELEVNLDESNSKHKGNCIVTMPTGVVHGFKFHPDTKGVVLSLAINMLGLDAENQVGNLLDGSLNQPRILSLRKSSPLLQQFFDYLQLIKYELSYPHQDQQVALFSLVKLTLVTLVRLLKHEHSGDFEQEKGEQIASKYRKLLEEHYREHWKINDYANVLHVSASTLNRSCQNVFGCTAKKLIQERLHIETKRRLIYTKETLDQISYALGYKDPAYFSKVFKSLEGVSPRSYRTSINQEAQHQ